MSISPPRHDNPTRENYHPPGYPTSALHTAFIVTDLMGEISPLLLTPAWLALAAIACWSWNELRIAAAVLALAFTTLDGIGLALLPKLERSFGPVTPPLLALALGHTAIIFVAGLLWPTSHASPGGFAAAWPGLVVSGALNLAVSAAFLHATWVEPFRIGVTQTQLHSAKLSGSAPLRLLQLSDLHVERITSRERALLRIVEELAPDIIVITGDYLNLSYVHDPQAQADVHDLLARLCEIARGPIYAITGSPPVDFHNVVPAIFEDLPITWLMDAIEEIHVNGHTVRLVGVRCTRERRQDVPRLRRLLSGSSERPFTLLLYHSPDLMPEAVELGVDLYLCGHTHGGQIRLPFFGAIITSSDFWKRYEMGCYEEGNTTLYVSRGLGMEGFGTPRARFLAPPEIVLWTLSGQATT
jgi:predicted MPP superfamily phosphohydrolase